MRDLLPQHFSGIAIEAHDDPAIDLVRRFLRTAIAAPTSPIAARANSTSAAASFAFRPFTLRSIALRPPSSRSIATRRTIPGALFSRPGVTASASGSAWATTPRSARTTAPATATQRRFDLIVGYGRSHIDPIAPDHRL
jgi:hypothetical protein